MADPNQNPEDHPRLSDGREDMGESFADPTYADRAALAASFTDPDSLEDTKLGKSFEETNSSAKKHHRPVGEVISEPFKKPASRKVLYIIVAAMVVVGLLALIIGYIPRHNRSKESNKATNAEEQPPLVDVVKVTRAKDGGGLVVPGTTTPMIESSVYARANGYLKKRFVDIGDHVRKGQLLAIIDAPDLDQQVDQAREQLRQADAQLAQQQTQLALTKVTDDRYQALVARGVFSRQDGDQREADYQAQRANVASSERNVEAFKANLRRVIALQSYERVTAPFDGVITQRNVDTGDLISTSGSAGSSAPTPMSSGSSPSGSGQNAQTNTSGSSGNASNLATPSTGNGGQGGALFTVAQADRLRIEVSVPEGYADAVKPGTAVQLNFQEYPTQAFYGNVARNAGSIDQNTRTLLTEIVIDNHAGKLLAGMYAVVTFAAPRGEGPLVISGDAIAIREDRPTVAVIDNGKIQLVPVTIGRDYGPEVEIVAGLKDGELIASSFTDEIQQGVKIRTQMNKEEAEKQQQPAATGKPTPPGGSTQYGDPGITDQDMQGQNAKPQQKKAGAAAKKGNDTGGSKQ